MVVTVRRPYFDHDRAAPTARVAFAQGVALGAAPIACQAMPARRRIPNRPDPA
jgi:hypothetical protein